MTQPQLKEHKLDLVLIGDFNPQIFQPEWFVVQGLLGKKEGESAKVEVIHSDIAVFNLDWMRFEVTRNRLVMSTKDDRYHEVLRDLIVGTFSVLSHTRLKMLGINNTFDYVVSDEKKWHEIGDKLAPKDIWNKFLDGPGLLSQTIQSKTVVKDHYKNLVRVAIAPTNVNLGLRIHINDHYELTVVEKGFLDSSGIVGILKSEWTSSKTKDKTIVESFFEQLA